MNLADVVLASAVFLVVALILRANLWRAILFLSPRAMHLEVDAPVEHVQLPPLLKVLHGQLLASGFTLLGSHLERAPLGRETLSYDYGHHESHTFATLYLGPSDVGRLYFLTATANGGLVLTANHRRAARELPGRYLSGSLESLPTERVFKAHQRRVGDLGPPTGALTLEARVALGQAWYAGPGAPEVRAQHALGLLWTLGTVGMVAAALFGRQG